nr:hypothetical protein [Actinomycetota bacterium]
MKIRRIVLASTVALALFGAGGAALASNGQGGGSGQGGPGGAESGAVVDTDKVQLQVGDQSAPDSTEATSSEGTSESDGPGGHEDPAGNVDHQFEGNE